MKTIKYLILIALFVGFTSCSSDEDNDLPEINPKVNPKVNPNAELVVNGNIANLHAPQVGGHGRPASGAFTKFDFKTGKTTENDKDWDIAFRGTDIIVNGGISAETTDEPERNGNAAAYVVTGLFSEITVDTSLLVQDTKSVIATKSGDKWYSYDANGNHLIIPLAGKILVFKTRDGKYAKLEVLSWYKDTDITKAGYYFTFNYAYQPNEGVITF